MQLRHADGVTVAVVIDTASGFGAIQSHAEEPNSLDGRLVANEGQWRSENHGESTAACVLHLHLRWPSRRQTVVQTLPAARTQARGRVRVALPGVAAPGLRWDEEPAAPWPGRPRKG